MWDYLIAMTVIPLLLIAWLLVQQMARRFARAHPELGPYREEGGGCGSSCGCQGGGSCRRRDSTEGSARDKAGQDESLG